MRAYKKVEGTRPKENPVPNEQRVHIKHLSSLEATSSRVNPKTKALRQSWWIRGLKTFLWIIKTSLLVILGALFKESEVQKRLREEKDRYLSLHRRDF